MAVTRISDVVVPEVFTPYVLQEADKVNRLIRSGAAVVNPTLSAFLRGGGETVNVPSWQAIDQGTGAFDLQNDDPTSIASVNAVGSGKEVAARLARVKTWGAANLAVMLAGSNPLEQVSNKIASAIDTDRQCSTIQMLKGFFGVAGALTATHLTDDSATAFNSDMLVDALAPWGDMAGGTVSLVVHSAIFRSMQKENLITTVPLANQTIAFPTYMGTYAVVVDDTVPVTGSGSSAVYTSYLLKPGAIQLGTGFGETVLWNEPLEGGGAGMEYFIQRDNYVVHMTGMKWIGNAAGATPSNAELATPANWAKVYTDKHIPVSALLSKA